MSDLDFELQTMLVDFIDYIITFMKYINFAAIESLKLIAVK